MTAQPNPDGLARCRAQYPRPANVPPNTRLIHCGLQAGHPGEHEEDDTEVTWTPDDSTAPRSQTCGPCRDDRHAACDWDEQATADRCRCACPSVIGCPTCRTILRNPTCPDTWHRDNRAADQPDLYQEAARAYSGTTADTPYVRGIGASDAFRAAVDRVAELVRAEYARPLDPEPILRRAEAATRQRDAEVEQRVRAEIVEQLRVTSVAANLPPDVDAVAHLEKRLNFAWPETDRLGGLALGLDRDLAALEEHCDHWEERAVQAEADLAAMTARAESAEARYDEVRAERDCLASAMEMAEPVAEQALVKLQQAEQTLTTINQRVATLGEDCRRLVGERDELQAALELAEIDRDTIDRLPDLERRAAILDITQLGDNGTRTLCCNCGHEQFTPASPPSATHSPQQATVEGQDPEGPQDSSGGAA